MNQLRNHVITWMDPEYPALLREIADPPAVLYTEGNLALLERNAVAVVGSRRASAYGQNAAAAIARSLSAAGVTVVSGMARGIDAAAHRAAMTEPGRTVAVLGTGIDQVYPRSHRQLAREIASSGLLLTEFSPGTPPRALNFPIRNRIIAGLSLGTVIVEATDRSGSLITARMAAEQGREVFGVPGPIFHAGSTGPHRLIQYGAKLVHDVDDIFVEIPALAAFAKPATVPTASGLNDDPLLSLIRFDEGLSVDELAALSGRAGHDLAEDLLRLEAAGSIRSLPGARYVRSG
ncbi:MAG TPA: DNA-processing protein DprA [Thermoanaerobaculia bacterium]|nr:DNA-processing protein DprA [Thermoanaerobaculia bacterium]